MKNIENYETKEVECLKCGWVGKVAKHIPLRLAWCGGCRSSRLRIYHTHQKRLIQTMNISAIRELIDDAIESGKELEDEYTFSLGTQANRQLKQLLKKIEKLEHELKHWHGDCECDDMGNP